MDKITLIDGNGRKMVKTPPKLIWITENVNDTALMHIKESTGLSFTKKGAFSYAAQPIKFKQIAALLLTYNYKTDYYNNCDFKNTLFIKTLSNEAWLI